MSHNLHRFQICIHASNTSQSSLSLCFLNFNSGQCCAMCYYSICFSSIMACNYCSDLTLSAIAEYAMLAYQLALNDGNEFTCDYLPQIVVVISR